MNETVILTPCALACRFPEVLSAFLEGLDAAGISHWRRAVAPEKGAAREDGEGEAAGESGDESGEEEYGSETLRPPEHGQLAVRALREPTLPCRERRRGGRRRAASDAQAPDARPVYTLPIPTTASVLEEE